MCKPQSGNQLKKNKMGGACSTHEGQERCIQFFFWCRSLRERNNLKYLGVDGRTNLNGCSISKIGDVDWIDLP
jgi:hypothetical protein